MAVPEQTPYIEHTGNGSTTSFALGFECETKDHLIVLVDEIEPPIATWSLTGGNVVFTTAPAAGKKIKLQRNTPFGRTTNYQSFNNSFRPQTVNVDFDRIWLKLQELGVADWLMKLYVDRLHQQQEQKINDLKGYVDDRDNELRAYLLEEIRKQGVALDQLDEYYNYLMQRLAQIAVDKGWDASFVVDASGQNQQEINDYVGADWRNKAVGYGTGDRVRLLNGDIARSMSDNNTSDPNTDKTDWLVENACTVDFSGLRLPTGTDISPLINPILLKTLEQPIVLILPQGEFTLSTNLSTPANSKGMILDLNGAVLKPLANYRIPGQYVISLTSTTTFPAKVCNGTIDGINRDQNLFEITNYNEYLDKCTSGVSLRGINVVLENMVLQNMYGQTTKYFCRHAITENVTILNCGGHWYANDTYDAFGDAFYIGTGWNTTGLITAYFKNVKAVCKYSRQYPENHQAGSPLPRTMYSRIGLTIEKFGGNNNNTARIHFENCDIRNVERGIHQEIKGITTSLSLNNSYISSCVLFGCYLSDTLQTYATNCTFDFLDSDWLTSRGVVRAYNGVSIAKLLDCTVRELSTTRQNVFGMSGTLEAIRTPFSNVGGLWGENLNLRLRDSTVGVTRHPTDAFPVWQGSTTLDNVSVVNTAGRKNYTSWPNLTINKATFENMTISKSMSLSKEVNDLTVRVPDADATDWRGYKLDVKNTSGNTVHTASVYWGVRPKVYADDKCVRYALAKPASGPLNIVTPEMLRIAEKSSLFVVVAKGQDSGALDRLDLITPVTSFFGYGYSVALARRDVSEPSGVKIVQPFSHVGNTGAYVLTFEGFSVTSYGSYTSHVQVAVVPYSELETLPQIPASFFSFLTPASVAPASTPTA